MGLLIEVAYGATTVEAYAKVSRPTVSGDKLRVGFDVHLSSTKGAEPISYEYHTAPFDMDGPNIFEQAYTYLKTLPAYAGAVDC